MDVISCTLIPSCPANHLSQEQQICNAARFCCLSPAVFTVLSTELNGNSTNPLPTLYLLSNAWEDTNGVFLCCCSCCCLLSHFFCWPALCPKSLLEANHSETPSNGHTLPLTYPKPSKTSRPIPHIHLGMVNKYVYL